MNAPIAMFDHFIAITPEDSPLFVRGPYTLEALSAAPMYSVFKGDAPYPGPVAWELFDIDTSGDVDAASGLTGLIVLSSEPERDDDQAALDGSENARFTDEDAWLAFLRSGGTLCKVPDAEGSPYYRMLVVQS